MSLFDIFMRAYGKLVWRYNWSGGRRHLFYKQDHRRGQGPTITFKRRRRKKNAGLWDHVTNNGFSSRVVTLAAIVAL